MQRRLVSSSPNNDDDAINTNNTKFPIIREGKWFNGKPGESNIWKLTYVNVDVYNGPIILVKNENSSFSYDYSYEPNGYGV